jgi:hypothetical protein
MRKDHPTRNVTSRAVALVAIASLLAFGGIHVASATDGARGGTAFFSGDTAQGQEFLFLVQRDDSGAVWVPIYTGFTISCPDGVEFTFSWAFIGFEVPMAHGTFDLSFPSDQVPFDWQGTLDGLRATGTQSQGYVNYDLRGQPQDCATGDVPWMARGVHGSRSAPSADYRVTVERRADGSVHTTIETG